MENLDNNKTKIVKYLRGEMSPNQRQEFEKEISSSSKLKELVEDMALFEIGSSIINKIEEGHIESESLARFAEGDFENETAHKKVEGHLEQCDQCRQLLNLCQLTINKLEKLPDPVSDGFFRTFFNYLLTPRFKFRFIYAPIAFFLLAIPIYFSLINSLTRMPLKASYEISESIERNVDGTGFTVIKNKTEIVELKFIVPVIDSLLYNFNLYDTEKNLIFSKPNNRPQKVFALQLPNAYLPNGNYTLVVDELGDGKTVLTSFRFAFKVSYSD